MCRCSYVNGSLRPIELSSGFQEIKGRPDRSGTGGRGGYLIVTALQPGSKASAADGPGFAVTTDHDIREGDAAGRMEQSRAGCEICEHNGCAHAGALVLAPSNRNAVANPVGPETGSRRVACSFRRVFLQSWRATLIGLMPASFHQARSSPTR
jgi:hypothetical protein